MAIEHKHKPIHQRKQWVERVTQAQILECSCGGKYIKTRPNQTICVACMVKAGIIK